MPRPQGLYCPLGDFYVDPTSPVDRAIITHGHSDHARTGHGRVLATPETLAIMRVRYGADFAGATQAAAYGEPVRIGAAAISLHPAGHVLGSAQLAITAGGMRIVVSGDYKRQSDPTCAPFEVVPCDVFVTEATFALPVFRHPDAADEIGKLLRSATLFPQSAHIAGAYALGKAQRVLALIRQAGWEAPIYLHGALQDLTRLYEQHGQNFGDLRSAAGLPKKALEGAVVLCPPGALQSLWSRRFPDPVSAFASGWMRVRARARQRGVELPLVISDHADWPDLTRTIRDTGAREVWITHGEADALAHWCGQNGIAAQPLHLLGYGDEEEPTAKESQA